MAFCIKCGAKLNEGSKFCVSCGAPQKTALENQTKGVAPLPEVKVYTGQSVSLTLEGQPISVSPELDVFNHYRLVFRQLAENASARLLRQYETRVRTIDDFLVRFDDYYIEERTPLLEAAFSVLTELGYYDITLESFANQHTKDYCLIVEDLNNMLENFNAAIEANQSRRARAFNLLPGVIFGGGVGGFLGAVAYNVGVNAAAEAAIAKANVSRAQRAELFRRINTESLMNRAFTDYWRIFLSMTYTMKEHGFPVWYPTGEGTERIKNMASNLKAGRIPSSKVPEVFAEIVRTNPYNNDCFVSINNMYPENPEVIAINDYFGFDGKTI